MGEDIQFEADIGEVFKLETWLGRTELSGEADGLLWNLCELMVMAGATEHDLIVEVIEVQVESPNLDEEVTGGT